MEDIREELAEETTTPVEEPKPKKKKVAQPPTRLPEDLESIAPKKMTDKEKDLYIEYLRQDRNYLGEKCDRQHAEFDSAYQRVREAEDRAKRIAEQANLKLNLVKDNVRIMANNVMTILEK